MLIRALPGTEIETKSLRTYLRNVATVGQVAEGFKAFPQEPFLRKHGKNYKLK